jgi:hypothetical protein
VVVVELVVAGGTATTGAGVVSTIGAGVVSTVLWYEKHPVTNPETTAAAGINAIRLINFILTSVPNYPPE